MARIFGKRRRFLLPTAVIGPLFAGPVLAQGSPDDFVDAEFEAQYGLGMIGAQEAYARGHTGKGVVVGVIDSGLDLDHPEFTGRVSPHAINLVPDRAPNDLTDEFSPTGPFGHGTEVSGIIAAARDGEGMHGVAHEATILPVRAIVSGAPSDTSTNAIAYAREHGAAVINGSFGPSVSAHWSALQISAPQLLNEGQALYDAAQADIVQVYSAGNGYETNPGIARNPVGLGFIPYIRPGNYDEGHYEVYDPDGWEQIDGSVFDLSALEGHVLTVVAVDEEAEIASYSNRCGVAQDWCLAAPAQNMYVPAPGGGYDLVEDGGTSSAAPHVAGAAAVLREAFPYMTAPQIIELLLTTASDLGDRDIYGHGLLDLAAAIQGPGAFRDDFVAELDGGDDSVWENDIAGSGGLTKRGAGTLTLTGDNTYTGTTEVEEGTLRVLGSIAGTVDVASAGVLRGTGTIGGQTTVAGTLAPGASPGTLTFTAPVVQGPGSTLALDIDGPGTGSGAGSHSRIVVTGAGNTFTADGTIRPVLRGITPPAGNDFTPALGQSFDVVEAEGGILGGFATLDQPASGLPAGARFDTTYHPNLVRLVVTPASYGDLAALGLEPSANRGEVGGALENMRPAAGTRVGGERETLFHALAPLDGAAIGPALDRLGGVVHAQALGESLGTRRMFGEAVEFRQELRRDGGGAVIGEAARQGATTVQLAYAGGGGFDVRTAAAPTGDGAADDAHAAGAASSGGVWGRVIGNATRTRGDGNGSGSRGRAAGFMLGADGEIADDVVAGIGLGYARQNTRADGGLGRARVDSFQVVAYAGTEVDGTFVDGQLGYAFNRYDTSRDVVVGGLHRRASGEADGHDVSASLRVGQRFEAGEYRVEPWIGVRADRVMREAFSETGAGGLNLRTERQTRTGVQSRLGVRVARTFVDDEGRAFEPELRLRWDHEFVDRTAGSRAALEVGGDSFTVKGTRVGRDTVAAGIGVAALLGSGTRAYVDYEGAVRHRQTSHTFTGGLRFALW